LQADTPTEIIEGAIRFAEVNMGAKFDIVSEEESKREKLDRGFSWLPPNANKDLFAAGFELTARAADLLKAQKMGLDELIDFTVDYYCRAIGNRAMQSEVEEKIRYIISVSTDSEFMAASPMTLAEQSPQPVEELKQVFKEAREAARNLDSVGEQA